MRTLHSLMLLLLLPASLVFAGEAATAEDVAVLKAALAPDCADRDRDPQFTVLTARFMAVMPSVSRADTPYGQAYGDAVTRTPADSRQDTWPQALQTGLACPALRILDAATIDAAQAKSARDRSHPFAGGNGMVVAVTLPGYSRNHDLAMVQRTVSCGVSCGGMWTIWLSKTPTGWRILRRMDGGLS